MMQYAKKPTLAALCIVFWVFLMSYHIVMVTCSSNDRAKTIMFYEMFLYKLEVI